MELVFKRLKAFIYSLNDPFPCLFLFDAPVDSFLDEDFLKGGKVPLLLKLV